MVCKERLQIRQTATEVSKKVLRYLASHEAQAATDAVGGFMAGFLALAKTSNGHFDESAVADGIIAGFFACNLYRNLRDEVRASDLRAEKVNNKSKITLHK